MQIVDVNGNMFGDGTLEVTTLNGKPKVPVINTDITIGTTAIVSGVVGRVLFQGTGNVVQESPNITWDNTNKIFKVSTGTEGIVLEGDASGYPTFKINTLRSGATRRNWMFATEQINAGDFVLYRSSTGGGIANTLVYSIFNDGNFGLNTSTNAGYKADINGTLRVQSSLVIANPAFTNGGTIAHTANSTLYITGGPGAGGENITFGPSNRIFINAQQTRFPNGSVQMSSTLTVGSGNATSTNMLLMQGSITAASAIARGQYLNTTLVAAANNDVLVGIDINPIFTVNTLLFNTTTSLRINTNHTPGSFSANNNQYGIDLSPTFRDSNVAIGLRINPNFVNITGSGAWALSVENTGYGAIRQTSTATPNIFAGITTIGANLTGANGFSLNVANGANGGIKIGSVGASNQHLIISHSESGATFSSIRNTYAVAGSQMLIDVAGQGNLRLFGTGNVGVKTTVDAGFTFDVNGNTRSNRFYATDGITLQRISFEGFNNQVGIDYNSTSGLFKFFASGNNFLSAGWNLDTIIAPVRNSSGGNFGDVVINVGGSERARFKNTGNLLINTTTDVASSQLTIESTTKGFLPPRMTTVQKVAIATPAAGLVVYDTTLNKLCVYTTAWETITSI